MLYSEFLKGTGATENADTYGQFEAIERIYMDCDCMTKAQAYRLWKSTYGKEIRRKRKFALERLKELTAPTEEYEQLPYCDKCRISDELNDLFWKAYFNEDSSECRVASDRRCYSDGFGIVWFIKSEETSYRTKRRLFAYYDGKIMDAYYES